MDWVYLKQTWHIWAGGIVLAIGTILGLPVALNKVLEAYDKLVLRFFGADVLDCLKAHFVDGGGYAGGVRLIWYQPVSIDEIAKKIGRARLTVKMSINQLRRDGKVKPHEGDKWIATGGA